jgi:hypothetical protein
MAGAAPMPELQKNSPLCCVNGIRCLLPSPDLGIRVNSWFSPERGVSFHSHCRFGNNQSSSCSLGIVLSHQTAGDMIIFCTTTGKRSHQNSIWQHQRIHLQGLKKAIHNLTHLALEDFRQEKLL